jgi:AcrR family transcriptional regulator
LIVARTRAADAALDGSASTSSRVLSAGAQLFREQTYAQATTRELSARLGITNGSLYYHVANKEDLLYKICMESLVRVTAAVSAAVDAEEDPLLRVRAIFDAHLGSVLSDLDLHATMLFELRSLTGERRTDVQSARDQYQALVTSVVADAQKAGALRTDLAAKHLTLGLLSMLNWAIAWYDPTGSMPPEKLAEMFWDLFTNGAVAPS